MTLPVLLRPLHALRNRPVVTNTFGTLILRATTTVVRLVVLFIIARAMPPDQFGVVVYVLALTEILKVVADFGVDTVSVREYAIQPDVRVQASLAASAARAKLACGFAAYIVLLGYLALDGEATQLLLGSELGLLIFTFLGVGMSVAFLQAHLRMHAAVVPGILTSAAGLAAVALAYAMRAPSPVLILILPLMEMATALALLTIMRRQLSFSWRDGSWPAVARLLRLSAPVAVTSILVASYTRLDILFLNRAFDSAAVGYYGVAYRMTEPFLMVAAAFAMSIYSHMSRVLRSEPERAPRTQRKYLLASLAYGLFAGAAIGLIAPELIRIFLPQYLPAIDILRVLAAALVVRSVNTGITAMIQAYGRFKAITAVAAFNLVLILALLAICLPRFGVAGAAVALLIGELVNTLVQGMILIRARRGESGEGSHGGN